MINPWLIPGIDDRLRELHAQGLSHRGIAEGLNTEYATRLTKHACIGRANRIGLPHRPSPIPVERTPRERKPLEHKPKPIAPSLPKPKRLVICDTVPLEQLDHTNCHYPLGEVLDRPPYLYCGLPAREGFSWCPMHYCKVYVGFNPRPIGATT